MLLFSIIVGCYSYFLGCICGGYYIVKWKLNQDLYDLGSGTLGARNVGRVLGLNWAIVTIFIDLIKGTLAVSLTKYFFNQSVDLIALAFTSVIFGHIYPIQLKFKGGKGIATFAGGLMILNCQGFMIALTCALIMHTINIKPKLISIALALISVYTTIGLVSNLILKTNIIFLTITVLLFNFKANKLSA